MKIYKSITALFFLMIIAVVSIGQGIPLGETLLVSHSTLKSGADPDAFKAFMTQQLMPAWNEKAHGLTMYLTQADRGDRNGDFLITVIAKSAKDRKTIPKGSPFTDKAIQSVTGDLSLKLSDYFQHTDAYTDYQLIGADQLTSLPAVDLLGFHYIKIKSEKSKDFEKFVVGELHPAVGHLVQDMNLLYYKAVEGQCKGSYITLFAIESAAARERFWPTGGPEQDIVKQLFAPHKDLATELKTYLVEDSYLKPESGGGAAIFESLEWTDFVLIAPR